MATTGLVAVLAAGCSSTPSGAGASTTTTASGGSTGGTGSTGSTGSGVAAPHYEVRTGTVKGLGKVLVDGQGFTLYLFVPDKQSGTSTCYGQCAVAWPPLLLPVGVSAPVAGPGVNASLLGVTSRTDGSTEITYDKWPLYLWQSDSEPGQATGQALNNLGGLWYVVAPDGQAITTRPPAAG
jgi:predicted lipoprotein with Yx(FWY)xxD motif